MRSHPPGEHHPTCSNPDNCPEYASIMTMTPHEHARWLSQDVRMRAASNRGTLRVGTSDTYAPPDIYAEGLAKLRGEHVSVPPLVALGTNANPYSPPDAYASALAVMRAKNKVETKP